jgi:hypothetical protein
MSKPTTTSEPHRRKQRRLEDKPNITPDDRVHSFHECAAAADVSPATFRRQIASGRGPVVTRISPRRVGIRGRHFCAWLDSRAVGPDGS